MCLQVYIFLSSTCEFETREIFYIQYGGKPFFDFCFRGVPIAYSPDSFVTRLPGSSDTYLRRGPKCMIPSWCVVTNRSLDRLSTLGLPHTEDWSWSQHTIYLSVVLCTREGPFDGRSMVEAPWSRSH